MHDLYLHSTCCACSKPEEVRRGIRWPGMGLQMWAAMRVLGTECIPGGSPPPPEVFFTAVSWSCMFTPPSYASSQPRTEFAHWMRLGHRSFFSSGFIPQHLLKRPSLYCICWSHCWKPNAYALNVVLFISFCCLCLRHYQVKSSYLEGLRNSF